MLASSGSSALKPPLVEDLERSDMAEASVHSRGPRRDHTWSAIGRRGEHPTITTGHAAVLMHMEPATVFAGFPEAGGYPVQFLPLAYQTLGVTNPAEVLHLCSGSVRVGITLDIRADVGAQHVADCRRTPFADESFDWIMADPPYSRKWAKALYGLTKSQYPTPAAILKEAERLLRPGGRVGILHYIVPNPIRAARSRGRVTSLRLVGVWGVVLAMGTAIRAWTVFEKPGQGSYLTAGPAAATEN